MCGRFTQTKSRIFAFAGLWHDGRCVIITRAADSNMQGIHDRMPVILPFHQWNSWLANVSSRQTAVTLDDTPAITIRPVSRHVNSVAHDDPSCLDPAEIQANLFPPM